MNRRTVLTLAAAGAVAPSRVLAQSMSMPAATSAPLSPKPTAAERPFVARIQRELPPRYPTPAAAGKVGYFQYTPEDKTGAISYVNLKVWNKLDIDVPNQLWYDVNGRLLGADYTVLAARSPSPPATLFGYAILPGRWVRRGAHVHWGFTAADGTMHFGGMRVEAFTAAGGTPSTSNPDIPANKVALVKSGVPGLTDPAQVKFVFLHPTMWDLVPWVLPNPDGAWADANPNVKPSHA